MIFFNKKNLSTIALILLVGCTDSDAEIKELNTNELNDVISTSYIEKKQSLSNNTNTPQTASISSLTPSSTQAVSESKFAGNTITTEAVINSRNFNSKNPTDTVIEKPLLETKDVDAEKTTNTVLSKPTILRETLPETVLKELLVKYPTIDYSNSPISSKEVQIIDKYCTAISERLSSVSKKGCLTSNHRLSAFKTVDENPIVITEFAPKDKHKPLGKILVIGGTHGDELTSVSTAYKWISNLNTFHSGLFHWRIVPALNADGMLKRPATRPNANGVDINRNLPTHDWDKQSSLRWEKLNMNPHKNPGNSAASEPETQWIMHEIATFKPDVIISIHAPYSILDSHKPQLNTPKSLGRLQLNLLGTYPGSLGNYAGIQRKIPVLTLELPDTATMPSQEELRVIWNDMITWLRIQLSSPQQNN